MNENRNMDPNKDLTSRRSLIQETHCSPQVDQPKTSEDAASAYSVSNLSATRLAMRQQADRSSSGLANINESSPSSLKLRGSLRNLSRQSSRQSSDWPKSPKDSLQVPPSSLEAKPPLERMPYRKKTEPSIRTEQHLVSLLSHTTHATTPQARSSNQHLQSFRSQPQLPSEICKLDTSPVKEHPLIQEQQTLSSKANKSSNDGDRSVWWLGGVVAAASAVAIGALISRHRS